MGLIVDGRPLTWAEGRKHAGHIKDHGITQLINIWKAAKDRKDDEFLWGEEVSGVAKNLS